MTVLATSGPVNGKRLRPDACTPMTIARAALRLLLLMLASLATAAAEELDRARFNPILASIVKVEAVTEAGSYSLGSAVAVAPGRFVTSCHVTAKAESVALLYQGLRWPVRGQRANTGRDLCLLDVPRLASVAVVPRASARDLEVGDPVAAAGYTFGAGLSTQVGTIRALHPIDGGLVLQSATYFNSGASGGGLFTMDGRLVGILTFRLKGAEAYYFSIPADWIDSALAGDDDYRPIAPLPADAQPFWSQPVDRLPYFMRAAVLEARRQWADLAQLAQTWAAAEPGNAESWFVGGDALSQMDRYADAVPSFRKALELNPRLAVAWLKLGIAERKLRHFDEVQDIARRLDALAPELAAELRAGDRDGTH